MMLFTFYCVFGQAHCAGLDTRIRILERQLADLQVRSEGEDADAMEADDSVAPAVDSPPLPHTEEGSADGEDDRRGDIDEDEEDEEETASDAE